MEILSYGISNYVENSISYGGKSFAVYYRVTIFNPNDLYRKELFFTDGEEAAERASKEKKRGKSVSITRFKCISEPVSEDDCLGGDEW